MPSFQFLRVFVNPLSTMSIVSSVPMIFLLVGLQAIMDVKFSCPCRVGRNHALTSCIFFAPAISALVIMLLLLRPCKYKSSFCSSQVRNKCKSSCCSSQEQNNSGTSQGKDSIEYLKDKTAVEHLKEKTAVENLKEKTTVEHLKEKDTSGTSQSEKNELVENFSCCKVFVVCCIPCLVWICIFFIDGDYLACGFTDWNGHYACYNKLHPRCENWCNPTKLSPGKNEIECYERTLELIWISKITGYVLAIIFCILAIIYVSFDCKSKTSVGRTDPESQGQQGPGKEEQPEQRTNKLPVKDIENATENVSLLPATTQP